MIEKIQSHYFGEQANGIILDNAYDLYKRNQYAKYMAENGINYLRCKDEDMNLLAFFPNAEYVTVPEEAKNIDGLYNLKRLKGLEITAKNLEILNLSCFNALEYLIVHDYSKKYFELKVGKQLKRLALVHSDIENLDFEFINCDLKALRLEFCYNLKTLKGIRKLGRLNRLELDYCLKLENIEDIKAFSNSLNYLRITDCNKIQEITDVLFELSGLETLYISTSQTNRVNNLTSVKFIEKQKKLKDFMTDYKIEDGDLKPLLNVENVDILKFYKNYNLKRASFE